MAAGGPIDTQPFCGSCGWDASLQDKNADLICDSCGADLTRFGFTAVPPADPNLPVILLGLPDPTYQSDGIYWRYAFSQESVDDANVNEMSFKVDEGGGYYETTSTSFKSTDPFYRQGSVGGPNLDIDTFVEYVDGGFTPIPGTQTPVVVIKSSTAPTSAPEGAPSVLVPANAYVGETVANMIALGALGNTGAWATGSFVQLLTWDGADNGPINNGEAYWDGATWQAGIAP